MSGHGPPAAANTRGRESADLRASADDRASAHELVTALEEARERTLALVAPLSDADLEQVHSTLMSPLVWDLGHIAAFEDLWLVHRFGEEPMLRPDLVEIYDAMETPRSDRGELPFLRTDEAHRYLARVRARALELIDERGVGDLHELVLRHEQQHNETMLQTMQLARRDWWGPLPPARSGGRETGHIFPFLDHPPPATPPHLDGGAATGLEFIEVPAGECTIGARAAGDPAEPPWTSFAYDNERPRHRTDVRGFEIGEHAITNASYLTFVEGGGYRRREWWSDEGWSWKEQYDITRPGSWTADLGGEWRLGKLEPLHPERPVVHVSWFEADAFARSQGVRLPAEFEWEKAATWDQERGEARPYPWGGDPPVPGVHANVDWVAGGPSVAGGPDAAGGPTPAGGPAPAGGPGPAAASAYPAGASPNGCLGMIGDTWEWTASELAPYPGFVAYPYREYSEPFFGGGYKVLRGGSWATRARIATPTFRNWDFPQRRQIFSGIRVAQ